MKKKRSEKPEEKIAEQTIDVPESNLNAPLKVEEQSLAEEDGPQEKSNKSLFFIGGAVLAMIILTTVGFLIFSSRQMPKEEEKVEVKTEEPTPPPKPSLDRTEWSFEVLNGSGVSGVAKKAADKLTDLGYNVVNVGNADRSSYKGVELYISKKFKEKTDLLITDLKKDFNIASVAGELKDSTASAQIIIGKE